MQRQRGDLLSVEPRFSASSLGLMVPQSRAGCWALVRPIREAQFAVIRQVAVRPAFRVEKAERHSAGCWNFLALVIRTLSSLYVDTNNCIDRLATSVSRRDNGLTTRLI